MSGSVSDVIEGEGRDMSVKAEDGKVVVGFAMEEAGIALAELILEPDAAMKVSARLSIAAMDAVAQRAQDPDDWEGQE
jgi:hypothetical protein